MFLTTPVRTWPSLRLATSSERASARLSSSTARRDTTMLPRLRSILRIWNGCGVPSSGVMSRTGRISTWLPGRNATAPLRSTVKPPFTRPKMVPLTRSLAWKLFSSRVQASSRHALSRLICAASRPLEFLQGHPAFGLQPDIDQNGVVLDRDHGAFDYRAFEPGGGAER